MLVVSFMKSLMHTATLGLLASFSTQAHAGNVYFDIGLGVSLPSTLTEEIIFERVYADPTIPNDGFDFEEEFDIESGAALKLALGYEINDVLAIEIERSARAGALEEFSSEEFVGAALTAANLIVSLPTEGRFQPYAGVGIGYANLDSEDIDLDDYDGAMAFQLKAGMLFNFRPRQAFGLEATYVNNGSFEFSETTDNPSYWTDTRDFAIDYDTVDVTLHYRFRFGQN